MTKCGYLPGMICKLFRKRDGTQQDNVPKENDSQPADFEAAISATGYGKFHFFIIFLATGSALTLLFETTTMAFVVPVAECDLHLSLNNKGLLNAIIYIGCIVTVCFWGFLVDTLGRKKLLIFYLVDAVVVVASAFSQSFLFLALMKFLGGLVIYGSHTAFVCYLSEMHCAKHRARAQMLPGIIYGLGNIIVPLLAWAVLPQNINIKLGETFVLHSWNIFLLIGALPALITGVAYLFMPESPKFLMTNGNNEQALAIFKRVYAINNGKPGDTYPIKELIQEVKSDEKPALEGSNWQMLKGRLAQCTPLFSRTYVWKLLLIASMQLSITLCLNTIRLWLPQIYQGINEYSVVNNGTTGSMCEMLPYIQNSQSGDQTCTVNFDGSVYQNSMITATTQLCGYFLVSYIINIVGKTRLLKISCLVAGLCDISMYFAQNVPTIIALASVNLLFVNICLDVSTSIAIDVFPTSIRAMALSILMVSSRFGAVVGNVLFPLLVSAGCAVPFFLLGSSLLACCVFAFLLPKTDMAPLK